MKKILLFVLMFIIFTIPVQASSDMTLFQLEFRNSEKSVIQKYEYNGGERADSDYKLNNFKNTSMSMDISGPIDLKTIIKMEGVIEKYNVEEWFNLKSGKIDDNKEVFHLKICTDICKEVISNQIPENIDSLSKELRDLTLKEGFLNGAKVLLLLLIISVLIGIGIIIQVVIFLGSKYLLYKKD